MAQPGETIDQVVAYMFSNGRYFNMTASTKRALLIHNNPILKAYLNTPFTKKMLLNISPVKLNTTEKKYWKAEYSSLNRELYTQAVEKPGKKVVHSKKASHMAKMQQFLKNHPKYGQLTRHLKDLPKYLLSKTDISPVFDNAHTNFARQFRKHVSLPLKKWHNPTRYVNPIVA